jgi:hypothetical protein
MNEKFETVWNALVENGTSKRNHDATERFWNTLSPKQQDLAYANIPRKVKKGKYVQYDPIRAIKENSRKYQLAEPTNYNGNSLIDSMAKTTPLVCAKYNGHTGIFTLTDAIEYNMTISYGFNFNYEQYLKEQTNG